MKITYYYLDFLAYSIYILIGIGLISLIQDQTAPIFVKISLILSFAGIIWAMQNYFREYDRFEELYKLGKIRGLRSKEEQEVTEMRILTKEQAKEIDVDFIYGDNNVIAILSKKIAEKMDLRF